MSYIWWVKLGEAIPDVEKLCTAQNRKVFNNGIGSFLTLLAKFDCHRQRAISSIAFFLFSPRMHNSNMNYCFVKRTAPAIWSKIESQMQRGPTECNFQLSFTNLEDFGNEAEQQRWCTKAPILIENVQCSRKYCAEEKFKMKTDWYGLVGLLQKEYAAMMKRRRKSSPMIFFCSSCSLLWTLHSGVRLSDWSAASKKKTLFAMQTTNYTNT